MTVWSNDQVQTLKTLYLDDARLAVDVIRDRLNVACGTAYTEKAVHRKITRLQISNRNNRLIWTAVRTERFLELYDRADAPSYEIMAGILNSAFGTKFTKSAIAAKVAHLKLPKRDLPKGRTLAPYPTERRREAAQKPERPKRESPEIVRLRCVEIEPRHLSLIEIEPGDCHFPYGDGPFTFCGHPKMAGASYCVPHYHLTHNETPILAKPHTRGVAA